MAILELSKMEIQALEETTFAEAGYREREDLQRLLREKIDLICPNTMVITEEFGDWEESRRRIDLLALDQDANLVVVELKRTEDGGHMDLQAIRYAAMVSTMTFDQVVSAHEKYLERWGNAGNAQEAILDFLEWEAPKEDEFAQDVRIVLVSAEFSKELTTAVVWLNERNLDIQCIRLKPYKMKDHLLLDAQRLIPLPEVADYQVRVRQKEQAERGQEAYPWTYDRFMKAVENNLGKEALRAAKELYDWAVPKSKTIWWGKGKKKGSMVPVWELGLREVYPFHLWTDGIVAIWMDALSRIPSLSDGIVLRKLAERINEIEGFHYDYESRKRIRIPLRLLLEAQNMKKFQQACEWFRDELQRI